MPVLVELFGWFCHQAPDRSPEFQGAPFPVCFRCAGLYIGALLSYFFLAIRGGLGRSFPPRTPALVCALLTAAFPLDGWANGLALWDSPAWARALTGVLAGAAIPILLLPLAAQRSSRISSLPDATTLALPLCAGAAIVARLTQFTTPVEFELAASACAAGLIFLLANFGLAIRGRSHA